MYRKKKDFYLVRNLSKFVECSFIRFWFVRGRNRWISYSSLKECRFLLLGRMVVLLTTSGCEKVREREGFWEKRETAGYEEKTGRGFYGSEETGNREAWDARALRLLAFNWELWEEESRFVTTSRRPRLNILTIFCIWSRFELRIWILGAHTISRQIKLEISPLHPFSRSQCWWTQPRGEFQDQLKHFSFHTVANKTAPHLFIPPFILIIYSPHSL